MRASNQLRPLLACAAALCFASVIAATPASATVSVNIDLTAQRMHVEGAGQQYDWPVSSARDGYVTPDGTFKPERMFVDYHSKKYENAPMPNAIFFYYGFAIHGTNEVAHLGHPASHGCIRLSRANAAKLFAMVKAEGATITITGAPAGQQPAYVSQGGSGAGAANGGFFQHLFGN